MQQDPIGFMIDHGGEGFGKRRSAILTEHYDARKPEFWCGCKKPDSYTVVELFSEDQLRDRLKAASEALGPIEQKYIDFIFGDAPTGGQ